MPLRDGSANATHLPAKFEVIVPGACGIDETPQWWTVAAQMKE